MALTFLRGSEWRKWDLHFHTPSSYDYADKSVTNKDIVKVLKQNNVMAIAVTDHNFIDITRINELKNEAAQDLTVFPGIELCTDSRGDDPIHITAIFPENSDISYVWKELEVKLNISKQLKEGKKHNEIYCRLPEASKEIHSLGGIVLIHAGSKSNSIEEITNSLPVKMAEKKDIAGNIDVFEMGQEVDVKDYNKKVFPSIKKIYPMVLCSDNHNINKYSVKQNLWIKADLTFEGLRQILIEPEDRVYIGAVRPDKKEGYQVIDKIIFKDTSDFPTEIQFNSNLCSIIGSRSSGKSALLNYIAHSIDKIYTESILDGPAVGKYWDKLPFTCSVVWADGSEGGTGKVVFLKQGYLSGISENPEEITKNIKPVLFNKFPTIKTEYVSAQNSISSSNKAIEINIERWFSMKKSAQSLKEEVKLIGEKTSIIKAKDDYQKNINEIKASLSLSDQEIKDFQAISADISLKESNLKNSKALMDGLTTEYFDASTKKVIDFSIDYSFNPSLDNLPSDLKTSIEDSLVKTKGEIVLNIQKMVSDYTTTLESKIKTLEAEIEKICKDNKVLIDKNKQNEQLVKLVESFNKQEELLTLIKTKEDKYKAFEEKANTELKTLSGNLISRKKAILDLEKSFNELSQKGNDIEFGVECGFNYEYLVQLSEKYNLKETKGNSFINKDNVVDVAMVREQYADFLLAISLGRIKLKNNESIQDVATKTLTFSEEIRFSAVMEGDSIGGFSKSSMTPGKQALFALTLMLNESNDAWPLLIDQPEDDLDSRSIYTQIAKYFKNKKRERQIIMVSHNANLVIGADSEQIIVANKHGNDRKNSSNQLFDYLTGSLENTRVRKETDIVLETCGIREHACDILDGGEEAFYKREQKYKLNNKEG